MFQSVEERSSLKGPIDNQRGGVRWKIDPPATDYSRCGIKGRGKIINMVAKQADYPSAVVKQETSVDACLPLDIQPLVFASVILKLPGRTLMNLNGSWMAWHKITPSQQWPD